MRAMRRHAGEGVGAARARLRARRYIHLYPACRRVLWGIYAAGAWRRAIEYRFCAESVLGAGRRYPPARRAPRQAAGPVHVPRRAHAADLHRAAPLPRGGRRARRAARAVSGGATPPAWEWDFRPRNFPHFRSLPFHSRGGVWVSRWRKRFPTVTVLLPETSAVPCVRCPRWQVGCSCERLVKREDVRDVHSRYRVDWAKSVSY